MSAFRHALPRVERAPWPSISLGVIDEIDENSKSILDMLAEDQ